MGTHEPSDRLPFDPGTGSLACRDVERLWNEQLDARAGMSTEVQQALEFHAAACPACRAVFLKYQTLRQAIRALGPMEAPPSDLADRILAARDSVGQDSSGPVRLPFPGRLRRVAMVASLAASLLVAVGLTLRLSRPGPREILPDPSPTAAPRPLTEALADATSASLDLAREASAPAARLGQRMLRTASLSEPEWPISVDVAPASGAFQTVGDRVGAGVRPLSGSARHAFSFLLGPAPASPSRESRPGA
jgi:hypothetical protein